MSCPTGQENPARSSSALSRLSRPVGVSVVAHSRDLGSEVPLPAVSACALRVPVCRVAPGFCGRGSRAGQDPASLLFVAPVLSAPGGSWCPSQCCRDASACLFLSVHLKGFPTTSQQCLIGHRICPILFCLAVLAWQAGELACWQLSCGAGVGRRRQDLPGSWHHSAMRRRRRGTAGTPWAPRFLLPCAPARLAGPASSALGFSPFPFPWQSWLGLTDLPPRTSRGLSVAKSH